MPRTPLRRRLPALARLLLAGSVVAGAATPVHADAPTPPAEQRQVVAAATLAEGVVTVRPHRAEPRGRAPAATPAEGDERRAAREAGADHRALTSGSPERIGRVLAARAGWTGGQWSCLDALWSRESDWQPRRANPTSGAYGIPQALPASKMASAGRDWRTNPATQIRWGLGYVADRYGSPCDAWSFFQARGWY